VVQETSVSPRDEEVVVDDLPFHLRVWSETGPPVILVHGLASSARIWDRLAPLLAGRFRVVAIDQRGHGESAKPDDGYDLTTAVADLRGIARALGVERAAFVGHSWGGNVVLQYAASYPAEVSHLVLLDGGFIEMQLREEMSTWEVAEKQLAPPDLRMPFPAFVERMRNRLGANYTDEARDAILGNFWVDERGIIHPHLTRERHLRLARALWGHRPSRIYAKVACPTLILPAEPPDLRANPDRLRAKRQSVALAEQRIPRARVHWLRDTIHDAQLQRPAELAGLIEPFLLSPSS
jgi:pimeloyl-ACP methyl ester carboxylesterase